jgi:hypothetical protein
MVNANIDIFEISNEKSDSYSKRLETLDNIRLTKVPDSVIPTIFNKIM